MEIISKKNFINQCSLREQVPQATLPKTGASDPMLFSGLEAALFGLGLFFKKRK